MVDVRPRKRAAQARSRATVAAITEAAARILAEAGLDAVTTNAVAERAGVGVGSLYQYYPNRDAIVADLLRGKLAGLGAAVEGAVAAEGLDLALDVMLRAVVRSYVERPALASALVYVERLVGDDTEVARLRKTLDGRVVAVLVRHGVPDPEVAARDLAAMARGLALAAGLAGEWDVDAVVARIRRAAQGYLGR